MGTFVFMVLVVVLIAIFLYMIAPYGDDRRFICPMAITVIVVSFFAIPYVIHNSSVVKIKNSEAIIEIQVEYKSKLEERLNSIPDQKIALMNADSPVSTIVKEIALSEQSIRDANESILSAKMNIQARESGLTSYILWFY